MFYTHQQQMLLQASSFEKTFTGVMCCPAVGDDVDHYKDDDDCGGGVVLQTGPPSR